MGRLYGKVEVCVNYYVSACPKALAWPLTHTLELWEDLAEDTCCKGQCDPSGAVLCLLKVQHMSRSPAPDWEGICSYV